VSGFQSASLLLENAAIYRQALSDFLSSFKGQLTSEISEAMRWACCETFEETGAGARRKRS